MEAVRWSVLLYGYFFLYHMADGRRHRDLYDPVVGVHPWEDEAQFHSVKYKATVHVGNDTAGGALNKIAKAHLADPVLSVPKYSNSATLFVVGIAVMCLMSVLSLVYHAQQGLRMEKMASASATPAVQCISFASLSVGAKAGLALRQVSASFVTRESRVEKSSTFVETCMNIITCGLGSGILCLPWATAGATLLPAILTIFFVLLLNFWTVNILVEVGESRKVFDLGGLLGQLPGVMASAMQIGANIIIWASMFLCLVGYFVTIVDCVYRALHLNPSSQPQFKYVTLVIAATGILPLCYLDQKRLAFMSTLGVIANIYLFVVVADDVVRVLSETVGGFCPPCVFQLGPGSASMVSTVMQCAVTQMCVLPMYANLKDRSPQKFSHVIGASFSALFLIFSGFAVAGYIAYGGEVESNVLKDISSGALGTVGQGLMIIAMAAVYPIMLLPMVAPLQDTSAEQFVPGIILLVVLSSAGVACLNLSLGRLNVINGSISMAMFAGLIPGVVGFCLSDEKLWKMTLLATSCLLMAIVGLNFTDNYVPTSCWWRG